MIAWYHPSCGIIIARYSPSHGIIIACYYLSRGIIIARHRHRTVSHSIIHGSESRGITHRTASRGIFIARHLLSSARSTLYATHWTCCLVIDVARAPCIRTLSSKIQERGETAPVLSSLLLRVTSSPAQVVRLALTGLRAGSYCLLVCETQRLALCVLP
jgi:hypothetical protein